MKIHFTAAQYAYCNQPSLPTFKFSTAAGSQALMNPASCSSKCWQAKRKKQVKYRIVRLFHCASYWLRTVVLCGVSMLSVWNKVTGLQNKCLHGFLEV